MTRKAEDAAFERYRRDGDPESLAKVFDALAPRLLLLAGHFARDAAEAEDLVQTTFLVAIRDAERWDPERPVSAWLAGVLRHRALDAKRRAALRKAEALSDEPSETVEPSRLAEDAELFEQVTSAIDELDEPYREVLVLRVVHGLQPTAIAHALGRAPGTVRMQLSRGLERLRRSLPERSALLGALFLVPTRGLDAVRESVLAEAARVTTVAAAATTTTALGGILTMKLAAVAATVVCTVGLVAWWRGDDAARAEPVRVAVEGPETVSRPPRRPLRATGPSEDVVADDQRTPERKSLDRAVPTGFELTVEVVGRLEEDAVPDASVFVRSQSDELVRFERRTDEHGVARFPGLPRDAYEVHVDRHPSSFDYHPAADEREGTLRIKLPGTWLVRGRAVDLEGEGVGGARVYVRRPRHPDQLLLATHADATGAFELSYLSSGMEFLARAPGHQPSEFERVRTSEDPDGVHELVLVLGARGYLVRGQVFEPDGSPSPRALVVIGVDEDARDSLDGSDARPIAEERTKPLDLETIVLRADEQGRFESDEVPRGHALLVARADDPERGLLALSTAWLVADVEHELRLELARAARVTGRVVDEHGTPLAGLHVSSSWDGARALGSLEDDLGELVARRHTGTDEDGRFALVGLLPGEHDVTLQGEREDLAELAHVFAPGEELAWNPRLAMRDSQAVRVLGVDGAPIERAIVMFSERSELVFHGDFFRHTTDADGRVVVPELEAGRSWFVSVHVPDTDVRYPARPSARRWPIEPSDEELVIRLRPEDAFDCVLTGRLVDERGDVLTSARFHVHSDTWGATTRWTTGDDGRFTVNHVPAGRHELRLAEDAPELGSWTLGAAEERDVGDVIVHGAKSD